MLGYLAIQADIVAFFVLIARLLLYLHHKTKQSMIFSDNPFNQNAYGGKQKRICQMLLPVE